MFLNEDGQFFFLFFFFLLDANSISINHFGIFVLFRILNGLSKGNVSLSTAIVTDVTTENKRGKGFATIGIAFSIGFIVCSINSTHFNSFNN